MWAAYYEKIEVIRELLSKEGTDINIKDILNHKYFCHPNLTFSHSIIKCNHFWNFFINLMKML